MSKKYKAAVIGCGRIGSEFDEDPKRKFISSHAGAYSHFKKTKLVAVCDLDIRKLEKSVKKWQVPSFYQNYQEMLRKEKIDILSICTPSSTHLDIIKNAVNYKLKAIFCEKPFADTLKNADEIVDICKREKILLIIDHQRRFDLLCQRIRKYIINGNLGDIQQVTFYYTAGISNTGSHLFDLLRFFFGDVQWVWGIFSKNLSLNPADPNIDGIIGFNNGVKATIQALDVSDYTIFETDILGKRGRIKIIHAGFDVDFYKIKPSKLFSGYKELYPSKFPFNKNVSHQFMINGVKHIVNCLDGKLKPLSTGEDGVAALELSTALYLSARNYGKKINLPLSSKYRTIKLESK